jgi:CBS domain-containing protein
MTAIELINDVIIPLEPNDKVSAALRQMDEVRVGHLPVIHNKKLLGLIFDDDLLQADDESLPMHEFSRFLHLFSVNQHDHFYNALQVMVENKLSLIPVTDQNNYYLGAINGEDLLNATSEILSVKNPGGIIILHVNEKDFSLAEIARLVESNDIKILSVGVHNVPGSTLLQITLKLNKINIEPVIQTFNRFEYDINAYFGENEKDEELLRDRYDSLMHYLNF